MISRALRKQVPGGGRSVTRDTFRLGAHMANGAGVFNAFIVLAVTKTELTRFRPHMQRLRVTRFARL